MHLLFDLTATQPQSHGFHGGGEYAKAVFGELARREISDLRVSVYFDQNRQLDSVTGSLANSRGFELHGGSGIAGLKDLLERIDVDRFYSALPYGYQDINFRQSEVIFTIHGLRTVETPFDIGEFRYLEPDVAQWAKWLARGVMTNLYRSKRLSEFVRLLNVSARRCTFVVPSEHTRFFLMASVPHLKSDNVVVCFSPSTVVSEIKTPDVSWMEEQGLKNREFFLVVSADRWIKNGFRAVAAIDKLLEDRPSVRPREIVIVGGAGCRAYKRWIGKYRLLPQLSGERLAALYQSAYALVFSTLNEGFGYPPLEAMSFGTPVLASAVASVPEVCGDAALYFDPRSYREIQARVLQLCLSEAMWQEYSERGRSRAQQISLVQRSHLRRLVDLITAREAVSEGA